MNRRAFDLLTLLGLAVSLTAVLDMLLRWELTVLMSLYLIWGVACGAAVAVVLLSRKARASFHAACGGGSPLLWLRLLLTVAVTVLGWYINAASVALYGKDSPMVAGNGYRLLAVIFTMVVHVLYFGFTHRRMDDAEPPLRRK